MNTVSGNTSSVASKATSVLGSARQALKAMAEAATSPDSRTDSAAGAGTNAKGVRRGTVLDRYL